MILIEMLKLKLKLKILNFVFHFISNFYLLMCKDIPYRNTIKNKKNFKINKDTKYNQYIEYKPNGFWYEINDCAFKMNYLDWGKYIYKVELDISKILIIKNYNEYIDFHNKYGIIKHFKHKIKEYNFSIKMINWKKVSEKYSGFEVINYNSIKKKLSDDFKKTDILSWLDLFDFSSGCIWNLNDLKIVKYICSYKKKNKQISKKKKIKQKKKSKKRKKNYFKN